MTSKTLVSLAIALATLVPVTVSAGVGTSIVALSVPETATVGVATPISCAATDSDGMSRIAIQATDPDGISTVLGAAFGLNELSVEWVPAADGAFTIRCRANGLSGPDALADASRSVTVSRSTVVPASQPLDSPVPDPTSPMWVAEPGASIYVDALAVKMVGPRKVAATPDGALFVADLDGRLHRLTRRGDPVTTALNGVTAVAAGSDIVFAGLRDGSIVEVHPGTGRILGKVSLGTSEGPAALAYDEARTTLWIAFPSGTLQARRPDGSMVLERDAAGDLALSRLVDVAVDPAGLVWVAQDRNADGGMIHGFDPETGEYVRSIGSSAVGQVRIVGGLAVAAGRIYVSDIFSGDVQVLDPFGAVLDVVGHGGAEPGALRQPAGLAFMANGDLLVANMDANRLDRFGVGIDLPVCAGDADCDGLPDAWEQANGLDPFDPTNAVADADGDGLNDTEEYASRTNPRAADTDADGYADADEVASGFDPTNPDDHRPAMLVDVPSEVDPGLVLLGGDVNDRGKLGSCSAAWRQVSGPAVELRPASGFASSFVARRGVYRFEAVATCAGVSSAPAAIDVTIRNLPPVADGGRIAVVGAGKSATLSGAFSSDVNGDPLVTFWWDQLLGTPVLGTTESKNVSVRIGTPGYYLFSLGVLDDAGAQGAAEVPVVVVASNGAPTATISSPMLARVGERVVLDASASYRSATAAFSWEQVSGPYAALDAADSAAPAFVPDAPGRYTFDVAVVDADQRSAPARVEVYVAAAARDLPVARIAAPAVVDVNAVVTLDGAGSAASDGGALSYMWRQVSGPAAGLTQADRAAAKLVAFDPGSYELELMVDDGTAVGLPARVRIEARAGGVPIPQAVASGPGTVAAGAAVVLDGTASTGATGYRWTQVEGPWVEVEQGPAATFVPAVPGVYAFDLEVTDGVVRSAPARVVVVVFPNGTEIQ